MKPGTIVRKEQVDSAAAAVQRELARMGFWCEGSRLAKCEIYWCRFPQITMADAYGFFVHHAHRLHRALGYEEGHIYIPKWVLSQGFWQERGSLRDVLRHEYGHAVAHYYPRLVPRSRRFRETFGGSYFGEEWESGEDGDYVSNYAQSHPSEDFAETFMIFLRSHGKMPAKYTSSTVKRKWQFVAELASVIRQAAARS